MLIEIKLSEHLPGSKGWAVH